jgi:hypothetical protein
LASRRRPEVPPPTFFVDRGLGKVHVPQVFRDANLDIVLMAEMYPDGEDQRVGDDQWIRDVDERGMVALTKDAAIAEAPS